MSVITRGLTLSASTPLSSGLALILALIAAGSNSLCGIGPMMPKWLRVGFMNTGIAPVMMIACRIDLWQLRSTTTTSPGATVWCQTILLRGAGAVGDEEAVVGVEDARGVALAGRHRAGVVQQLAEFVHRVADVGAQHVLAEELVEHLADRAFQERHAARVARAVPGVGAVLGVVEQRLEERRLHAFQVALGLADDVARHELRRVLEHVDEAVQLAQDVVGDVARGLGLAVHVDRHVGVLAPHLLDEGAQVQHRRVEVRAGRELLVVDRQDEGAGAALLLRELRQVAVAGDAQHLEALGLDGLRQRADAQAGGVLGAVVFVDDDDGKAEFHGRGLRTGEIGAKCTEFG